MNTYGNIQRVKEQRCSFEACHALGTKTKSLKRIQGTIVGAVDNAYWHPYVYAAYHIVTDDGQRVTVLAKHVRIPGTIFK